MSCCGSKRQALYVPNLPAAGQDAVGGERTSNRNTRNPVLTGTKFRYTGNQSLYVKGISNRRGYAFSASTPELMVSAEDAALLRGYPELIEVKRV